MVIENNIKLLLQDIIEKNDLPENSIFLFVNISPKGKKKGERTSISICISEPEYPSNKEKRQKSYVVMNIQDHIENVELLIRKTQFENIDEPREAIIKDIKSDNVFKHVIFNIGSNDLYKYIEENIKYCLDNYESSSNFACCIKYDDCSRVGKCIHINRLYSKRCAYRKNLEEGRIFY